MENMLHTAEIPSNISRAFQLCRWHFGYQELAERKPLWRLFIWVCAWKVEEEWPPSSRKRHSEMSSASDLSNTSCKDGRVC